MDGLNLHNHVSLAVDHLSGWLKEKVARLVAILEAKDEEQQTTIRQLLGGPADAKQLAEHLRPRANDGIGDLIGYTIARESQREISEESMRSLAGIFALLCSVSLYQPVKSSSKAPKLSDRIPGTLFPKLVNDSLLFIEADPAPHFGAIAFHRESDFTDNLRKITFQAGQARTDAGEVSELDAVIREWLEAAICNRAEKPTVKQDASILDIFQDFVSKELKNRQNSFLAKQRSAVPLALVWDLKSGEPLLRVSQLPNVFLLSGEFEELLLCYVTDRIREDTYGATKYEELEQLIAAPRWSGFLRALHAKIEDFRATFTKSEAHDDVVADASPSTRLTRGAIELSGKDAAELVEFIFPTIFFRNSVVISGQYNPEELPFCLSFNFSVNPCAIPNECNPRQLANWAAVSAVGMHVLLSEITSLFNDCALKVVSRERGRASGWEEHLEAMSHEARRLIRRVTKTERAYALDIIRVYFHTLLFSDSKSDKQTGAGITPKTVSDQLGQPFAEETSLGKFLEAMLRQAAAIEYLSSLTKVTAPRDSKQLERRITKTVESCDFSELREDVISSCYSDAEYPRKVLVGCAVVCVFRNVLKHRDPARPRISFSVSADGRALYIHNFGVRQTDSVGRVSYNTVRGGTYGAVSRYMKQYLSANDPMRSLLCLPGSPGFQPDADGLFTSILPLPPGFLCTRYT